MALSGLRRFHPNHFFNKRREKKKKMLIVIRHGCALKIYTDRSVGIMYMIFSFICQFVGLFFRLKNDVCFVFVFVHRIVVLSGNFGCWIFDVKKRENLVHIANA